MSHIDQQLGPHLLRDFRKPVMKDLTWIRTSASHDHLWPLFASKLSNLIEVDAMMNGINPVRMELVELATDVQFHPVGQMPALRQVQAKHRVARFQRR